MSNFEQDRLHPISPRPPEPATTAAEDVAHTAELLQQYIANTARAIRGREGIPSAGLTPHEEEMVPVMATKFGVTPDALRAQIDAALAALRSNGEQK